MAGFAPCTEVMDVYVLTLPGLASVRADTGLRHLREPVSQVKKAPLFMVTVRQKKSPTLSSEAFDSSRFLVHAFHTAAAVSAAAHRSFLVLRDFADQRFGR